MTFALPLQVKNLRDEYPFSAIADGQLESA